MTRQEWHDVLNMREGALVNAMNESFDMVDVLITEAKLPDVEFVLRADAVLAIKSGKLVVRMSRRSSGEYERPIRGAMREIRILAAHRLPDLISLARQKQATPEE